MEKPHLARCVYVAGFFIMKTLKVYASELIKVLDIVPRLVKFVVRVVKKIFADIKEYFDSIVIKVSLGRAPPVDKKSKKEKGGSRS